MTDREQTNKAHRQMLRPLRVQDGGRTTGGGRIGAAADRWIWLPEKEYPDRQDTKYSCMADGGDVNYTVTELMREYAFPGRTVTRVRLCVSGDTAFMLFADGAFVLRGPACVGGDFLYNDALRPEYYAFDCEYVPAVPAQTLRLRALVRMGCVRICDYSRGTGGFFLRAAVEFADGGSETIFADERWQIRVLGAYAAPYRYDGTILPERYLPAQCADSPVPTLVAPIPPCEEHALPLENGGIVRLDKPGESETVYALDRTYACYVSAELTGAGAEVQITGYELEDGRDWEYDLRFAHSDIFYGMELQSVGGVRVKIKKETAGETEVRLVLNASHYPAPRCAKTETSDPALDLVLDTCAHSLKYCRQTMHLDSPKHCEPLACTGDYYIETLMTAFTYGDMRLSAFDVHRTANLLRQHDGEMFHTTYSLIWVQMLWDVYRLTGDTALLSENADALELLLRRFAGYTGENGLIETPPNYMFVDWVTVDGIDLHHPPKALGQTCMCMFYFGALQTAEKICSVLGDEAGAMTACARRRALHAAIMRYLWDDARQLFFEGLNTPTPPGMICHYMPQNVDRRYYRRHANILAAYFGFFEREQCRALLRRILEDDSLGEVQPYFQHFLLDAVYRNGLREEYTLKLLSQWKAPVAACPKGLPEGFYKPTPSYGFDRSHAWAGTPAYALPLAVSGLKILEAGFKRITLSPTSLGLDFVRAEIPTPYGTIRIGAAKDAPPTVFVPQGIEYTVE